MTSLGIVTPMRALLLEPDPAWLEQRHRRGIDRRDEVWDGVLHVVPPPSSTHQGVESELEAVLRPIARAAGWRILHQLGVYDAVQGERNYRVPDLVVFDPRNLTERGLEGPAEVVVEILSPNDESREKFAFYATCGIAEYWIVDPRSREIELYVLRGGAYERVAPSPDGTLDAPRLALRIHTVEGPKLRIRWIDGSAEI